jgi:hypothetical protein
LAAGFVCEREREKERERGRGRLMRVIHSVGGGERSQRDVVLSEDEGEGEGAGAGAKERYAYL